VKGAIDGVVLGNLTGLLARIKPAIAATRFEGEKSSKNAAYVDAVAHTNVVLALAEIRRRSPVLEELGKKGTIQIPGAMYYLTTGVVECLNRDAPVLERKFQGQLSNARIDRCAADDTEGR
jgi:carbonic anhydrase